MKEIIRVVNENKNITVKLQGTESEIVIAIEEIFESLLKINERERITMLIYLYKQLSKKEKMMYLAFLGENLERL